MYVDWHQLLAQGTSTPAVVDPRRRLRICLAALVVLLAVVFGRAVQLELTGGADFREAAARPLVRRTSVPALRGRILARDGAVLACDRKVLAVAVHYRYLQEPCHPGWLRGMARSRLTPAQRKARQRVADAEAAVLAERAELAARLGDLCGLSAQEWQRRARQIQGRIERVAASVQRRRSEAVRQDAARPERRPAEAEDASLAARAGAFVLELLKASMGEPAAAPLTLVEELDYHVMAEDVPLAVVARIEAHPDRYPGVKIVERSNREYPQGSRAAHVLGHVGPPTDADRPKADRKQQTLPELVGRVGLERQYEELLCGRPGTMVELCDHGGRVLSRQVERAAGMGRDLVLTIDSRVQAAAESLLDRAIQRRAVSQAGSRSPECGGAIVVMDVHTGALLAAAAAPRFDPNVLVRGPAAERARLLTDPGHPLFDRSAAMALAPGSVFKVLTSVALLQSGRVDPAAVVDCEGYLDRPDRWRCAVFQQAGHGHGPVTLADALAESCNVYFFRHARAVGPEALVDWAQRFGFGRRTGVDLPGEAAGTLPDQESIERLEGHRWRTADTLEMSIGQGSLTVTPLQLARMMAAVANGGRLVTPHLAGGLGLPADGAAAASDEAADAAEDWIRIPPPTPIAGLDRSTLNAIDEGLRRVVNDPRGTAHATVCLETVAVAAKTGTAQAGADRPDHAWLAGYVPADRPRWAFVVVLEHAGNATVAAGPPARLLVQQMDQLGLLGRHRLAADR